MSESEHTEVGTKLVVHHDDAHHALERVKEDFEHLNERVSETTHELGGMLKQAVATAAGFQIDRGIDSIKEFGEEIAEAAEHGEKEVKNLAGVLAMSNETGASFEELTEQAKGIKEELEGVATEAGQAKGDVVSAFTEMAERTKMSKERLLELTKQMTYAGKTLRGGVGELSGAFTALETGMIRPRNAIVQMIRMTGTVKGTSRDIAKGLSAMVQGGHLEEALKIAEKAIGRMAETGKAMPATFESSVESLKNIREGLFEVAGTPLINALVGPLQQLKSYFDENKESIEAFGKEVGEKAGEWAKDAAGEIKEGFQYIQTHSEEIKEAFVEGGHALKAAFEFALAHKEEIALAYGIKTALPLVKGALELGKGAWALGGAALAKVMVPGAAPGLPSTFASVSGAAAGESLGVVGTTVAAFAAPIAFFAATVGAFAHASDQVNEALTHTQAVTEATRGAIEAQFAAGDIGAAKMLLRDVNADEVAPGFAQSMQEEFNAGQRISDEAAAGSSNKVLDDFAVALKSGNEAITMAAAHGFVAAHDARGMFETLGDTFVESGDELIKRVDLFNHDLAESLRTTLDAMKAGKAKDAPVQTLNMHFPGATFHIEQNFRNDDPDRIFLAFAQGVARAAASPGQAKTVQSHGS